MPLIVLLTCMRFYFVGYIVLQVCFYLQMVPVSHCILSHCRGCRLHGLYSLSCVFHLLNPFFESYCLFLIPNNEILQGYLLILHTEHTIRNLVQSHFEESQS